MDVEWLSSEDDEGYWRLTKLVKRLKKSIRKEWKDELDGQKVQLLVMEGSRKKLDTWKRSFHVIATNLIMESNTGRMKTFVETFVNDTCKEKAWMWWERKQDGTDNEEKESIVDLGVYTKNRVFRMPLAHKDDDESKTRFQRIAKASKTVWEPLPLEDEDDVLQGEQPCQGGRERFPFCIDASTVT